MEKKSDIGIEIECDVLVIGGGGGGLWSAVKALN